MSMNEHRSGTKLRFWCGKHQVGLVNFEESNQVAIPDTDGKDGVWEIDLSDFLCPQEVTEWTVFKHDNHWDMSPNTLGVWASENPQRRHYYVKAKARAERKAATLELDECVQTWEVQFWAPEVDDTEGDSWIRVA